ncbi:carbohydrate ABC transporter permease [Streptomyces fulvorobeus]|uniref:Multiple sugar transport system permease protein n=1 Tax=Streptomyces fulvorobeus TaxID=284028 RepID=A0A7J0C060_9ACTN|nr:sugar ABC transporter permease [Streptomyces fulvorobeus]NYE39630.1 multiple sugar transport system permease protein [Streptomyces fulvorobeus]GFM95872.1 sugar ABC transporter permease [Streptomyces fulvorobeus]
MTSRLGRGQRSTPALFIAPFFVLFLATLVAPVCYALWMSLFREQATSGLGFEAPETLFVGVDNYLRALEDTAFRDGFLHVALYCLIYIPVMVGGALALALLVDSTMASAKRLFQLAYFLPHAVPGLIAAIIWGFLYTPGLSPVVDFLNTFGVEWDFLGADTVIFSMANAAAWQWMGYNTVIFYAALQAVPRETLEAATVDGAGQLRTALAVKLPMIRSSVVLTMLFTAVGAIQLFNEPEVLRAQSSAISQNWSPVMYIYQAAFTKHDYGLAAAASLMLALLGAALSFVITKLGNRWKEA